MVLSRTFALTAIILVLGLGLGLAGCGQSLFDAHGKPDASTSGGPDAPVPRACPTPCLGDAAADFDGTASGAGDRWRYLDDHRDRTWAAMTPNGGTVVGADPADQFSTCASEPSSPACAALPGALLVSSGSGATADPAIAFPATAPQVIQLSVLVHVPAGAANQVVRLYRNSREDVLFTATAMADTTLERAITVDALAGDRFHVALAGGGAAKVGLHMFVNDTGTAFPSKCQLAVAFSTAIGNAVDNLCGPDLGYNNESTGPLAPVLAAGPFAELGSAADIAPDTYYKSTTVLDKSGDVTVQLWLRLDALVPSYSAWAFSDYDLVNGGGLGIVLYDQGGLKLDAATVTSTSPTFDGIAVDYPADGAWRFVRVVHTANKVSLCLDGSIAGSFPVAAGKLTSTFPVHLGENLRWSPTGAFFDGGIDDVRVFSTALPCN